MYEQELAGKPLPFERIDTAVRNLYGNWDGILKHAKKLLDSILACRDLKALFLELSEDEAAARNAITIIEKKYPGVVKESNVDDVIAAAMKKSRKRRHDFRIIFLPEALL